MKRLTPEEKQQRKVERQRLDEEERANAPRWMEYKVVKDTGKILASGDAVWLTTEQGAGTFHVDIHRALPDGGRLIEGVTFHLTLEQWTNLADAAIRRVKWLRAILAEDLDPTVKAALDLPKMNGSTPVGHQ
jgi:hypothetical protein